MKKMKPIKRFTAALAVTLVAVLGLASASAEAKVFDSIFTAGSYPASVEGTGNVSSITMRLLSHSQSCDGGDFTATLDSFSEELHTSSVDDPICSYFGGGGVPAQMNGCNFQFDPGAASGNFNGEASIGPSDCGPIVTRDIIGCRVNIPPQNGLTSSYAYNGRSGALASASVSAQALQYTRVCTGTTYYDGGLTGTWDLAATGNYGQSTGMYLADLTGLNPTPVSFNASKFPTSVHGDMTSSALVFGISSTGKEVDCQTSQLDGTILDYTTSLSVSGSHGNCYMPGVCTTPTCVTVNMHSCGYALGVDNSGPSYAGSLSVECSTSGDSIDIKVPGCRISIPAQTVSDSLAYQDQGSGWVRTIDADLAGSGIQYTTNNGLTCNAIKGTGSDGTLTGEFSLQGAHSNAEPMWLYID